jgi:hypothetical protein
MPQYLIYAHDGKDEQALERRLAARAAHLDGIRRLKADGHFLLGGAILNNDGQMIGSTLVMDFPDEAGLQQWLDEEPYIREGVWAEIVVHPFRVAQIDG